MHNWQKAKYQPDLREKLLLREVINDAIRWHFKTNGFREVETPLFVPSPDPEPTIEPYATQLELADGQVLPGYLITSPEFAMKKLLAGQFGSIFQICKAFRNGEPASSRHNSEFTILEWYRVNADYTEVMKDCEGLLRSIASFVAQYRQTKLLPIQATDLPVVNKLDYQGKSYDLSGEWERLSVLQAFGKYAGIDEATFFDRDKFASAAQTKGYQVSENDSLLDLQTQVLVNEIEPMLGQTKPTFLYDYPAEQAALARKKPSDPRFAERFELYLAGLELGNAFSELADPVEQEERLLSQTKVRQTSGRHSWPHDADFIDALREGIPSTGGIAVGIDRLVMLFADAPSIQDTLTFPQREWLDEML